MMRSLSLLRHSRSANLGSTWGRSLAIATYQTLFRNPSSNLLPESYVNFQNKSLSSSQKHRTLLMGKFNYRNLSTPSLLPQIGHKNSAKFAVKQDTELLLQRPCLHRRKDPRWDHQIRYSRTSWIVMVNICRYTEENRKRLCSLRGRNLQKHKAWAGPSTQHVQPWIKAEGLDDPEDWEALFGREEIWPLPLSIDHYSMKSIRISDLYILHCM